MHLINLSIHFSVLLLSVTISQARLVPAFIHLVKISLCVCVDAVRNFFTLDLNYIWEQDLAPW